MEPQKVIKVLKKNIMSEKDAWAVEVGRHGALPSQGKKRKGFL